MKNCLTVTALCLLCAIVLLPTRVARAQVIKELIYLPSTRVEEAVRSAAVEEASVLATNIEQHDDHAAIMVRRAESGAVELHEAFDDVYVVQQGAATLLYGERYEGGETTEPGEMRGGTIVDGTEQPLAPGDVAVVPAGLAHQIVVEPGQTIIYLVLKVRRGL